MVYICAGTLKEGDRREGQVIRGSSREDLLFETKTSALNMKELVVSESMLKVRDAAVSCRRFRCMRFRIISSLLCDALSEVSISQ
jgi:hypothetical protein